MFSKSINPLIFARGSKKKYIGNGFYYKNSFQMIFDRKMHWK